MRYSVDRSCQACSTARLAARNRSRRAASADGLPVPSQPSGRQLHSPSGCPESAACHRGSERSTPATSAKTSSSIPGGGIAFAADRATTRPGRSTRSHGLRRCRPPGRTRAKGLGDRLRAAAAPPGRDPRRASSAGSRASQPVKRVSPRRAILLAWRVSLQRPVGPAGIDARRSRAVPDAPDERVERRTACRNRARIRSASSTAASPPRPTSAFESASASSGKSLLEPLPLAFVLGCPVALDRTPRSPSRCF